MNNSKSKIEKKYPELIGLLHDVQLTILEKATQEKYGLKWNSEAESKSY